MQEGKKNCLSRRDALIGAGKLAAGAAIVTAGVHGLITPASASKPAAFPWGYKKIDPQLAGNIAFENWYKGFCCYELYPVFWPLYRNPWVNPMLHFH